MSYRGHYSKDAEIQYVDKRLKSHNVMNKKIVTQAAYVLVFNLDFKADMLYLHVAELVVLYTQNSCDTDYHPIW